MNVLKLKWRHWMIWGIALPILYLANWSVTPEIVGVRRLESYFRPKGQMLFDSVVWKRKSPGFSTQRYEMVDDILSKRLQLGLDRRAVEAILGEPDLAAVRSVTEVELSYNLASQEDYPARSFFFPWRLGNLELWILLLRFRDDRLYSMEVLPT